MTAALPSDKNSTRIADHNTIIANCSTITADHSTIRANRAGEYLVHVMLDGEDVLDLLRGGAPLPVEVHKPSGTPRASGAAQLRVRTLDDAAYALRIGLKASNRGVLGPRTHTILTMALHQANGEPASRGGKAAGTRLVLVDLASGELHGPSRYSASPSRMASGSGASRSLAVVGACVAARAEGAVRGVPWAETTLSLLLREYLSGEFCTAILGGCGTAEADVHGTISTLHFLRHAGRLSNPVRVPQPPLESLLRQLRTLDERRALQQQRWLESRPPTLQGAAEASEWREASSAPATGGAEDLSPQHEAEAFYTLAMQIGLTIRHREDQLAVLRGHVRDMQLAISEAGKQRRRVPWDGEASGTAGGLSGAHEVLGKVEQATQLVRAIEEWLRETHEAHHGLRHALSLRGVPPGLAAHQSDGALASPSYSYHAPHVTRSSSATGAAPGEQAITMSA